jgi:Outer membrane protein beta-barrel domain
MEGKPVTLLMQNFSFIFSFKGPGFLILLIVLLSAFSSLGQDKSTAKTKDSIRFALQAGLSFSHFAGMNTQRDYPGGEAIVGFRGGGNVDIPVNNHVSLRPEILFAQKGYKVHDIKDSINIRTDLSYLKFPFNIVFKLFSLDHGALMKDFFKIGVGPYIAYAFHGKYTIESVSTAVKFSDQQVPSTTANYGDYYKRYDAGINYFVEVNLGNFYSQVGAAMGLTNIKPQMENIPPHQSIYKNSCFNLSYGWRF